MVGEATFIASVRAALATYDAANPVNPPSGPTLVLIGDSRLNGDWNALLGRSDILNLSVAGSKSSDWLANWQANLNLIPSTVTKAIVQYGKNEIDASWSSYDNAHGIQDVSTIIQTHRNIKAGVLATLPVSTSTGGSSYINGAITNLLPVIISQCATAIPVIKYLEGYQTLVSGGALLSQYTDDGSHLNAAGKAVYKDSITQLEAILN